MSSQNCKVLNDALLADDRLQHDLPLNARTSRQGGIHRQNLVNQIPLAHVRDAERWSDRHRRGRHNWAWSSERIPHSVQTARSESSWEAGTRQPDRGWTII